MRRSARSTNLHPMTVLRRTQHSKCHNCARGAITPCMDRRTSIGGRVICGILVLLAMRASAFAEELADALHAYVQQNIAAQVPDGCIVIGLVDEQGSTVIAGGKLDNGTDAQANGDTLFEIGSVTKTFTGLLLQDL